MCVEKEPNVCGERAQASDQFPALLSLHTPQEVVNLRLAKSLAKGRHGLQGFTSCDIYILINTDSFLHMTCPYCSLSD